MGHRQAVAEPHLKSLTAARFVAAILVVLYHFGHHMAEAAQLQVKNLVYLGFTGISFFFVLSGFVLTYTYAPKSDRLDTRSFYVARLARIYPVYFLSFCLAIVPLLINWRLGKQLPRGLGFQVPAYIFMLQSWFPWYDHDLNTAAWTLSVEMLFYAAFPFLLPYLLRLSRAQALAGLLIAAATAFVVPSIAVSIGVSPSTAGFTGNLLRFFPIWHVPSFIGGAFLARIYNVDRLQRQYQWWILPVGLACFLSVIAFNRSIFYFFLHDGALILPFSAIIYGLAAREGIAGKNRVPSFLVLLGDASYGIYILQFPMHLCVEVILKRLHLLSVLDHPAGLAGFVVLLSTVCVLIYKFYETPARRAIRAFGAKWVQTANAGNTA